MLFLYKKLELIPAVFEVHEHHIAAYKGKNGKIVRAEHPKEMLNGSIATPSIVSAVIHGKYTNAVLLYRQEQEFAGNDVNISGHAQELHVGVQRWVYVQSKSGSPL